VVIFSKIFWELHESRTDDILLIKVTISSHGLYILTNFWFITGSCLTISEDSKIG